MKITPFRSRGVEGVNTGSSSGIRSQANAAANEGRMWQNITGDLAKVAATFIERKENAQHDDQVADLSVEYNAYIGEHGAKDFFTADEMGNVSENMVPRTETYTDEKGSTITRDRMSIPAWEAYPHLLRQKSEAMIKEKAAKIDNMHLRNEFIRNAEINLSGKLSAATMKAVDQQELYVFNQSITRGNTMADAGDVSGVEWAIEQIPGDEMVREAEGLKMRQRLEMSFLSKAIRSNDHEAVLEMRHSYEGPDSDTLLPPSTVSAGIRDLQANLNRLTVGWGDADSKAFHDRMLEVHGGTAFPENIEQDLVDEKITYDQSLRLHSAFRAKTKADEIEVRRLENVTKREEAAAAVLASKVWQDANTSWYNKMIERADKSQGVGDPDIEPLTYTELSIAMDNYEDTLETGDPDPNSPQPAQYTVLRRKIQEKNAAAEKFQISAYRGRDIEQGGTANRNWGPDQKAVDDWVELDNITDPRRLAQLAANTGIMPQTLENIITHASLNVTSESAQEALAMYRAVKDANVNGILDLGKETKDIMDDAMAANAAGTDPVEAFTLAKDLQKIDPVVRQERENLWRSEKMSTNTRNNLQTRMATDDNRKYRFDPGLMSFTLTAPDAMVADYVSQTEANLLRHGNLLLAQDQAWSSLIGVWSPQNVGKQMKGLELVDANSPVKYGVEHTLRIDSVTAQSRVDAFAEFYNLDSDTLVIFSDKTTAKDGKTWRVDAYDEETGFTMPVLDEFGAFLRFDGMVWAQEGREFAYREKSRLEKAEDKRMEDAAAANVLNK